MQTCFNYCEPEYAFFSSDERKWINKIHKLKEKNPDEIQIIKEPEQNDGCIYAKLPTSWLRIQPKQKVNLTEEEKNKLSQRFRR